MEDGRMLPDRKGRENRKLLSVRSSKPFDPSIRFLFSANALFILRGLERNVYVRQKLDLIGNRTVQNSYLLINKFIMGIAVSTGSFRFPM